MPAASAASAMVIALASPHTTHLAYNLKK